MVIGSLGFVSQEKKETHVQCRHGLKPENFSVLASRVVRALTLDL